MEYGWESKHKLFAAYLKQRCQEYSMGEKNGL